MKLRYRTLCLSDIHLGTRGCKAEYLTDFLRHVQCRKLYLVGDIIDMWSLRKGGWYWSDTHNEVVRRILAMAREGTEVIYIPGNHDDWLRGHLGTEFNGIRLAKHDLHTAADGRRYLVLHGDEFDTLIVSNRWLHQLGSLTYDTLLEINRRLNLARKSLGYPYWSLAGFLKSRVKNAVRYITEFENALLRNARRQRLDGVICGHIHHPRLHHEAGCLYANCGDWVENCTALVEDDEGAWSLIHWVEESAHLLRENSRGELPEQA